MTARASANIKGRKILIAPLNWGLGHATRCMPIIDLLLSKGAEVHIGGDGGSFDLLREAYPGLPAHSLPSYNIEYPAGEGGAWKTLFKAPSIIKAIKEERRAVAALTAKMGFDIILSDNRYGAHCPDALSIFMCHQLRVLPPKGLRWGAPLIFRWHKSFFGRFDRIWIPDYSESPGLSGMLSHGLNTGMPTSFIGPQSRFSSLEKPAGSPGNYIAIILSGPEPQRTLLEIQLSEQATNLSKPIVMVRGVVEKGSPEVKGHLTKVNYLHKQELFDVIYHADWVVCRPGYSTLMDLSQTGKKALLIPTPGQTEQEYLAENLAEAGAALLQWQSKIDLQEAEQSIGKTSGIPGLKLNQSLLEKALEEIMTDLQQRYPQR